jgi:hypothetical protein
LSTAGKVNALSDFKSDIDLVLGPFNIVQTKE